STWISYNTTIEVPFNFGIVDKRFSISIYGAADRLMNLAGLTFDQLKNQSYNSIIKVENNAKDLIISDVEFINATLADDSIQENILIFGHIYNYDTLSGLKLIVKIFDKQGSLVKIYPYQELIQHSGLHIHIVKTFSLLEYTIHVEKNESNLIKMDSYNITLPKPLPFKPVYCTGFPPDIEVDPQPESTPSPTPPVVIPCPNDCGAPKGNGYCNNGECNCIYPYSGIDCSSILLNTTITPNTTDPSVTINDQKRFESILAVVGIRELDPQSTQVNSYELVSGNWLFVSSSESNDIYKQYEYVYQLPSTNITSIIQIFDKSHNITFGSQIINMQPSTVKFTFNITSYPFSSSLNSLQLVLMASFKSQESLGSTCSVTDFIEDQGSSEYLRIQIQDRSLYGRFIKYGLVEGRETAITNTLLQDYKQSIRKPDETQAYIGLNIPYYKNSVQLDPDFSVLIEHESASDRDNSICTQASKNGLTAAQIAGIVIGGVVFIVIVALALIFIISKKVSGLFIPPSNEKINYVGRVDKSVSSQYGLAWPGIQISVLVSGTTRFSTVFASTGQVYYNVYIDNVMFVMNVSSPLPQPYSFSESLILDPTQTYNITLIKRTEAMTGISTFYGILVDDNSTLISYPKTSSRSIEFIGDSITCGYGILGEAPCPFQAAQEDISLTYGGIISRELEAQLYVESWSGKGVVKNFGSITIPSNQTLPELYPLTNPTEYTDYWDFNDFLPDAVVINLGTNDYDGTAPFPSKKLFEHTYIDFINFIKSKYINNPLFFLVCGPMITDPCCQYVQNVAHAVDAIYIDMQGILEPNDYGCVGHPNVEGHAKMASIALPIIQKNMGW
ncbi:hypothetical protein CYY_007797, partial [Polysphondylium violaceum]